MAGDTGSTGRFHHSLVLAPYSNNFTPKSKDRDMKKN